MPSREVSDSDFDATPLHKAHPRFVDKLEQILQSSAHLMITTGWKELAIDIGVEAQKLHEWERKADPVAEFIHYAVFTGPFRDRLTVGRLECHARNINNPRIVNAFREIKKSLRQGRLGKPDQPIARASDSEDGCPQDHSADEESHLQVFGLPVYRMLTKTAGYSHFLYPLVIFYCILQFFYSVWLTNEHDRPFIHPDHLWPKLTMLHSTRICIRSLSHFTLAYKLFVDNVARVPDSISKHSILRLLKMKPKVLCKLLKVNGDQKMVGEGEVEFYVLKTLNEKLNCLCLGVVSFALFITLFIYEAGGLTYHSGSSGFWDAWEGTSLFTMYITSGIACSLFAYEYRLFKYVHALVDMKERGMAELRDVDDVRALLADLRKNMIGRWAWLSVFTALMIVMFSGFVATHWVLEIPFALSCLPFPAGFEHRNWLYFVLIVMIGSALTYIIKENHLRAAKIVICIFFLPVLLLRDHILGSFLTTEMIHLQVLLYTIPLISLSLLAWTIHRLHSIANIFSGMPERHCHELLSMLFVSLSALAMLSVMVATGSEYFFVRNEYTSPAC